MNNEFKINLEKKSLIALFTLIVISDDKMISSYESSSYLNPRAVIERNKCTKPKISSVTCAWFCQQIRFKMIDWIHS